MLHPKNQDHVDQHTRQIAARHGVKIYRYSNVGNHLHLLVKTPTRIAFQRFLRELAGVIATLVTGAIKGSPGTFWDGLAYSRIVTWGRDLKNLEQYFIKNIFEAAGLFTRKAKEAGLRVIPLAGWGHGLRGSPSRRTFPTFSPQQTLALSRKHRTAQPQILDAEKRLALQVPPPRVTSLRALIQKLSRGHSA